MHQRLIVKLLIIIPIALLFLSAAVYPFLPHGGSLAASLSEASNLSAWRVAPGNGDPFLNYSSSRIPNGPPAVEFGGTFNSTSKVISATLVPSREWNLTDTEYLLLWIFADPTFLPTSRASSERQNPPFLFSVTLLSTDNSSKTFGNYSIGWQGWAQFALPLDYRGLLSGGNISNPTYIAVEESGTWSDQSLSSIKELRYDLIADEESPSYGRRRLLLTELETSTHQFSLHEGLNATIAGIAVFAAIILTPAYLVRYAPHRMQAGIMRGFRDFFQDFKLPSGYFGLLSGIVVGKIILATLTPLSSDFIAILHNSLPFQAGINPLTNTPLVGGFLTTLSYLMYHVWLLLPVDHPRLIEIFQLYPILHFSPTPGTFLLVLLLKTPSILADLLLTVLLYNLILRVGGSRRAASSGALFWLANPFNTLIIEMWSSFGVLFLLPLLASLYALIIGRRLLSAALLALSLGVSFWAASLVPFLTATLRRDPANPAAHHESSRDMITYFAWTALFTLIAVTPFLISNLQRATLPRLADAAQPEIDAFLGLRLQILDYTIILSVALELLYLFIVYEWWRPQPSEAPAVLLGFFLIFFATTHWLPQWFLWIMPFFVLSHAITKDVLRYPATFLLTILPLTIVQHSYYFSSWGNSFIFIPNLSNITAHLSRLLFYLPSDPFLITIRFTALLESVLVGICLAFILKLGRKVRRGTHA